MSRSEHLFVWLGGAMFVGSLSLCAYRFLFSWARAAVPSDPQWAALAADAALFGIFAAHHSVLAREPAKQWLAHWVPARLLRSAYVWTASLLLIIVCIAWQPLGGDVYRATGWRAGAHVWV